jgi:hypothetical protein
LTGPQPDAFAAQLTLRDRHPILASAQRRRYARILAESG